MTKERFTAWLLTIWVALIWLAGFRLPMIHAVGALILAGYVSIFPHWLVDGKEGRPHACPFDH